jgi:hypothetical protein
MLPFFLRILPLPIVAAFVMSSCVSDYYPGSDGNIFLRNRRPPKYGHGGTDSPPADRGTADSSATRKPRADVEGNVGATGGGDTQYLPATADERRERTEEPAPAESTSSEPSRTSEPSTTARTDEGSAPKPKPSEDSNLQFGIPVPGKEGLVYSPYYSGGYVDVKGMPPGSKARCPYTKKIFRVP